MWWRVLYLNTALLLYITHKRTGVNFHRVIKIAANYCCNKNKSRSLQVTATTYRTAIDESTFTKKQDLDVNERMTGLVELNNCVKTQLPQRVAPSQVLWGEFQTLHRVSHVRQSNRSVGLLFQNPTRWNCDDITCDFPTPSLQPLKLI